MNYPLNIISIGSRPAVQVEYEQGEIEPKAINERGQFFFANTKEFGEVPIPYQLWHMLYQLSGWLAALRPSEEKDMEEKDKALVDPTNDI